MGLYNTESRELEPANLRAKTMVYTLIHHGRIKYCSRCSPHLGFRRLRQNFHLNDSDRSIVYHLVSFNERLDVSVQWQSLLYISRPSGLGFF